ncbi:TetR/AcrR family transcriptional regulator [Nocardia barduliensis]|uniref:TetR/AcrR family transcriptional regulator n=1 Tax=Nocardia barduliensis TaxID=2736643 RepID=UPI00157310C9|nr:TetR/AcrR family transcriptional regulator [Nocardia barduliensis]
MRSARRTSAAFDVEQLTADVEGDSQAARILDAALAEFRDHGIDRVRMEHIARRAGLHRATVYRAFPSKDLLVTTALTRWLQGVLSGITTAVADYTDVRDRAVEGFAIALRTLRNDPLTNRILLADEGGQPFVITYGATLLTAARAFFAEQLRRADDLGDIDPDASAEIAARLSLTLLLIPDSYFSLETDEDARLFARRHLIPAAIR